MQDGLEDMNVVCHELMGPQTKTVFLLLLDSHSFLFAHPSKEREREREKWRATKNGQTK